MKRFAICATFGAAVLSTAVHANFTGFTAVKSEVLGVDGNYRVMLVYATFNHANDKVLNLFDAQISLAGAATPHFFQASDVDLELVESFLPAAIAPDQEAWFVDSFVTIGADQGNNLNGTIADPDFDDSGATSGSGISTGGWYNLPPSNGFGVAGSDLRVLVGQFTITEAEFTSDAQLNFSATLGYAAASGLQFASQSVQLHYAQPARYVIDDLDGDTKSDIVFVNPSNNNLFGWLFDGLALKQYALFDGQGQAGCTFQGVGDIDGDGKADVLWRNTATGLFSVSLLDGLQYVETVSFGHNPGNQWRTLAFTDISGDAKADILFFNAQTSQIAAWILDGPAISSGAVLGALTGAKPLGVGDFDGDGMRDILWRKANGEIWAWMLEGTAIRQNSRVENFAATIGTVWQVPIIADFDGDEKDDVIWRNTTNGMVTSWLMDGPRRVNSAVLHAGIPLDWAIEASPDLDGDGRRDLLWRSRSTGTTALWRMENYNSYSGGLFINAHISWSVVRPKIASFD